MFQRSAARVLRASSAQRLARSIERIVPKCTMYTHPNESETSAQTSESSADQRVSGSPAASGIWKIVRIVLYEGIGS